jgi:uncharacterized protein
VWAQRGRERAAQAGAVCCARRRKLVTGRMARRRTSAAKFSLAPVQFRNSPIEGRGVFARRQFQPGEVVVAYAPKQQRLSRDDPRAIAAAETKLTLVSENWWVIVPDTSVPGGWLCNHSCRPNADIYSDGEGRIQSIRPIAPGEEVTVFYGWVTRNEPERDPCRCGVQDCRGFINFDVSDAEASAFESETAAGEAFRAKLNTYEAFLRSIGQEQVFASVAAKIKQALRS